MTEIFNDDFDWNSSCVIPEQRAIAVYWNDNFGGAVVIREQCADGGPDHYIRITPEHAPAVAQAILREAGLAKLTDQTANLRLEGRPKDCTAAERARRYRRKKRDASRVTPRDGSPGLPLRAAE